MASPNQEAIEAWSGVLFDRFLEYRHLVVGGLAPHGEEALRWAPPQRGERALDIGCGFGDTTRRLAELVGDEGAALGVDAAPRFIETARAETEQTGPANVRFLVGDVQTMELGERFDYAFSRFGTMFFADPVAALRNVRQALRPGGRLCKVVWRRKLDNPWVHRAELAVDRLVAEPEDKDEATDGPGQFSMADADSTSQVVLSAGFVEVALRRFDIPYRLGRDLDEAVEYSLALGPAGEAIRLAGPDAERIRPQITAAVRDVLSELAGPDGVIADSSTWIVTARAPAS